MQNNAISVSKGNWITVKVEDKMSVPKNISKCKYMENDVDNTEAIQTR